MTKIFTTQNKGKANCVVLFELVLKTKFHSTCVSPRVCIYMCVCVQIYNMFPFVTAHCVDTETWIVDMGTNATAS